MLTVQSFTACIHGHTNVASYPWHIKLHDRATKMMDNKAENDSMGVARTMAVVCN